MQSQCSSYSSEEDEDEEPKTPERKNKVIDSPIVTPSPGNINSFEGRPVYLLLKCCLLLLCLMLAVVGCISIFRFQFSHISNHSNDAATSRNVRSVSIDIDRVLLEQLATINPKSRTVSQLLKDRPDLFVKTTHDQARQRFRYLNSKRSNDSDSFFELCNIHSIQISSEARIAILEENIASGSSIKKTPLKSSLKKNTNIKNKTSDSLQSRNDSSFTPTSALTSSFADSPILSFLSKQVSSSYEANMAQQMLEARLKKQAMRVGDFQCKYDEHVFFPLYILILTMFCFSKSTRSISLILSTR